MFASCGNKPRPTSSRTFSNLYLTYVSHLRYLTYVISPSEHARTRATLLRTHIFVRQVAVFVLVAVISTAQTSSVEQAATKHLFDLILSSGGGNERPPDPRASTGSRTHAWQTRSLRWGPAACEKSDNHRPWCHFGCPSPSGTNTRPQALVEHAVRTRC